jgi:hypothetical protein
MYDIVLNEFDETLRNCPEHLWEASMWDKGRGLLGSHAARPRKRRPDPRGIQVHSQFWFLSQNR